MIQLLALDVDGVLTDGSVVVDDAGRELKVVSYHDIDAVFHAHRQGLRIALVTGEDTPWVSMIARRLEVQHVYRGAKDKALAIRTLAGDLRLGLDEICFVGDSARDAEAFPIVGLALAPSDSVDAARSTAHRVLTAKGGKGAVAEAIHLLLRDRSSAGDPR